MISKPKTYSREIAVCLFIWLGYLTYEPANIEMVKVLVWPIFTFNLFAFGFKQPAVGDFMQQPRTAFSGGRDERSSQHTGGQEQFTNSGADK